MTVYVIAEIEVTDEAWIPEYAPLGSARQAGSNSRFRLIDDTDVAGTISYLGKG